MNWKRNDIIQVSTDFTPYSNFTTVDILKHLSLPDIISNIRKKPQRILQDWEYALSAENRNIIAVLERDQLSSPSKFGISKTGGGDYMKLAYDEFVTVYKNISFQDFCLFTDFVDKTYPNLFTTYYYFRNKLLREDAFFCTVPPNTQLYIGSVFEY